MAKSLKKDFSLGTFEGVGSSWKPRRGCRLQFGEENVTLVRRPKNSEKKFGCDHWWGSSGYGCLPRIMPATSINRFGVALANFSPRGAGMVPYFAARPRFFALSMIRPGP